MCVSSQKWINRIVLLSRGKGNDTPATRTLADLVAKSESLCNTFLLATKHQSPGLEKLSWHKNPLHSKAGLNSYQTQVKYNMLVQKFPWPPLCLCNIVHREQEEEAQGQKGNGKGLSEQTCLQNTVQCSLMSKRASEPE